MTKISDGGPAFPGPDDGRSATEVSSTFRGMSKREWFAGHAPPPPGWWWGFCDRVAPKPVPVETVPRELRHFKDAAAWAWAWADAMLAEREDRG